MHILFISNNFPPEVNAPANRLFEHAKNWIQNKDTSIEIITDNPNFPEGKIYSGYKNKFTRDSYKNIPLLRVPMYLAANQGGLKRILSYVSFMLTSIWYSRKCQKKPDVVVATSPQFFAALAGYIISRFKRAPFVLEIRDLWPESIVAVGAMKRGLIIRFFEWLELFLYRKARHIVVVTESFKDYMIQKGIPADKITILKNGVDFSLYHHDLDAHKLKSIQDQYGFKDKFICAYVGTIGMAHKVEVMIEAAKQTTDPDILYLVIGTGSEANQLEQQAKSEKLQNFKYIGKQLKEDMPYFMSCIQASLVHLRKNPLFKTVIPSKIFESMAMKTPIILGVEGEVKKIIQEANAGICIEPENALQLSEAITTLKNNPQTYKQHADDGASHVKKHYNRDVIAREYYKLLQAQIRPLSK